MLEVDILLGGMGVCTMTYGASNAQLLAPTLWDYGDSGMASASSMRDQYKDYDRVTALTWVCGSPCYGTRRPMHTSKGSVYLPCVQVR